MKKPSKPRRPTKPREPKEIIGDYRTSREPHIGFDDRVTAEHFTKAAKLLKCAVEDVSFYTGVGTYWDSTECEFSWSTDVSYKDPDYAKKHKVYEKKLATYKEKTKEYRVKNKEYKTLITEWEQVQKAEEIVQLKDRLRTLGA